jgi:hypothetical protein
MASSCVSRTLHLSPERPVQMHHSHHHQYDMLSSLSVVSPYQLLGRGLAYRHTPPQLPSLEGGEPPHFALYGTTPSYDHLRMFDFVCYPNTSATTPHKLSPRTTHCLFLGYCPVHKGYCYLDLASHSPILTLSLSPIRYPLHPSRPAMRRCPHHVRLGRLRACLYSCHARPRRLYRASSCATHDLVDLACATHGLVDPSRAMRCRVDKRGPLHRPCPRLLPS